MSLKDASCAVSPSATPQNTGVSRGSRSKIVDAALARLANGGEDTRSRVMALFRARGGSVSRWARADHEALADAITRTEDRLELEARGRMTQARVALRDMRRALEVELWP